MRSEENWTPWLLRVKKGIGYQPSSDSYADSYNGSYFDGIHLKKNSLPASYIHENIQVEPEIQVRCFSYEDAGVPVPATGTTVWKSSI